MRVNVQFGVEPDVDVTPSDEDFPGNELGVQSGENEQDVFLSW